jgi:uncharacterized membrane protein
MGTGGTTRSGGMTAMTAAAATTTMAMVLVGAVGFAPAPATAAIPCSYSLEYVQHPCGFPFPNSVTIGEGIADSGLVCGWWRDCVTTDHHSFLWPPGGGIQTIPYPPGIIHMQANDIASNGRWVAGEMETAVTARAFLRSADGTVFDLGVPPGGSSSHAHAVSSSGVVVGDWNGVHLGAFRWERGVMTDLTSILGMANGVANGIADNGLVTGWTGIATYLDAHAFVIDDKRVTLLPVIPGGLTSVGQAVNRHGDVVGVGRVGAALAGGSWHAYGYLEGRPVALPELPGTVHSRANDLNDDQVIVGYCAVDGWQRATMWIDGQVVDLNDLLVPGVNIILQEARSISSDGCIVAYGTEPTQGGTVAVRLIPIWPRFADFNCDQVVNGVDIELLLGQWGACCTTPCSADLTTDGIVNGFDLATLLAEWG